LGLPLHRSHLCLCLYKHAFRRSQGASFIVTAAELEGAAEVGAFFGDGHERDAEDLT
jgi:hypothetical protein